MYKIFSKLMYFPLVLALSSCSVIDAYQATNQYVFSPTDFGVEVDEHAEHHKRLNDNYGTLYVTWFPIRTTTNNSMSGIYIYVDGNPVSAVTKHTYTAIDLQPGQYQIAVGDSDDQEEIQNITISKNENLYYGTGVIVNFTVPDSLALQRYSTPEKAKETINKLKFVTLKKS